MLRFRLLIFFHELLLSGVQQPIIWTQVSDFKIIINSQRDNLKSVYKVRQFGVVHSFTRLEDARRNSI